MKLHHLAAVAVFAFGGSLSAQAADAPIRIIAAENFYGDAATAIGGDHVAVESIIVSPGTDPHDFEPAPSVARGVADAAVVIMNGAEYDHWMERLLESSEGAKRTVIDVAELVGKKAGDNPHIWYDPKAMPALAEALTRSLSTIDPGDAAGYETRKQAFLATLDPLNRKIADIKERFAGAPVTASEPVFGLMAEALGLDMRNADFQLAIMNETEPSAAQIAAMQDDIKGHRVKALFYNQQVVDALTERLLATAKEAGVPVVGVTETKPDGLGYAEWMLRQLDATEKALSSASS